MKTYKFGIIAPCFENNEHSSGLDWNTRFRLIAAVNLLKRKRIETIIVGGGKLREMKESFSELMKKYLIKRGVSAGLIGTEQYTYDTASQIFWVSKSINTMDDPTCFITDSAQANHIKALIKGFKIGECDVISMEEINDYDYSMFIMKVRNSFGWVLFEARELLLFLFTIVFDPRNEFLGRISIKRRT